ncbi:hypothetical protein ABPG75_011609 [Micractinium tetrahymenae]
MLSGMAARAIPALCASRGTAAAAAGASRGLHTSGAAGVSSMWRLARPRAGGPSEPPIVDADADWEAGDDAPHASTYQQGRGRPRAGGPSEPPIVMGGEADWEAGDEAPHGYKGTPRDSSEGPSPRTSQEDAQKTGGVGQEGSPASYRPPHATGGEGREFEEPKKK